MAIRVVHQPVGISGLAAYASGAGRKRERDLKYGVQLAQQGQGRRDKYNLQANQQQFRIGELNRANQFAIDKEERGVLRKDAEHERGVLQEQAKWERGVAQRKTEQEANVLQQGADFERNVAERDRVLQIGAHKGHMARAEEALLKPIPNGATAAQIKALQENTDKLKDFKSGNWRLDPEFEGEALRMFEDTLEERRRIFNSIEPPGLEEQIVKIGDDEYYPDEKGKPTLLPKSEKQQMIPYGEYLIPRDEYEEIRKKNVADIKQWDQHKEDYPDQVTKRGERPEVLKPWWEHSYPPQPADAAPTAEPQTVGPDAAPTEEPQPVGTGAAQPEVSEQEKHPWRDSHPELFTDAGAVQRFIKERFEAHGLTYLTLTEEDTELFYGSNSSDPGKEVLPIGGLYREAAEKLSEIIAHPTDAPPGTQPKLAELIKGLYYLAEAIEKEGSDPEQQAEAAPTAEPQPTSSITVTPNQAPVMSQEVTTDGSVITTTPNPAPTAEPQPGQEQQAAQNIMKEAARRWPDANSIEDIPEHYRESISKAQKVLDANRGGSVDVPGASDSRKKFRKDNRAAADTARNMSRGF